jgi:predicted membrane protein
MKGNSMGMYDKNNFDVDQANKAALVFLAFMLILCLIMVCANLFVAAAIAWKWVFAPIWGPLALGLILTLLGVKPPQ